MTRIRHARAQKAQARADFAHDRGKDRSAALRALTMGQPVVYAIRTQLGDIKIGCSTQLDRRRHQFGTNAEILAFTPGDFDAEAEIHERLQQYRSRGHEYYHPTPEVLAVVNEMRDYFSLPHLSE